MIVMTPLLAHLGGPPFEELLPAAYAAGAAVLGLRLWWTRIRRTDHRSTDDR